MNSAANGPLGAGEPSPLGASFILEGERGDVLDLKTLLITRGINVPDAVVERFSGTRRLAPTSHPFACNCLRTRNPSRWTLRPAVSW